jgi:hypothetical protein
MLWYTIHFRFEAKRSKMEAKSVCLLVSLNSHLGETLKHAKRKERGSQKLRSKTGKYKVKV